MNPPANSGNPRVETGETPVPNPPPEGQPIPASPDPKVSQLSPEEQMALFEQDLKDNDWGHQPC